VTLARTAVVLAGVAASVVLPAATASAHPLGNFTVNHYDGLVLRPDGVGLTAVVDRAEIPTAQTLEVIAPGGTPDAGTLADAATGECAEVAAALRLTVDDRAVRWVVRSGGLEERPGAAGLPTLRLTCDLSADADLSGAPTVALPDR
jgi:nickel/cobalt exporter